MRFKEYLKEGKSIKLLKIKNNGITWELKKDIRWGGFITYIIYKNGKEFGQYPPNLDKKIAIKTFKNDIKSGEIYGSKYFKK